MAFSYGFFNARNLDRVYTAEDFTTYLSSMICNGIFDTYGDMFSLTADGLNLIIGTGKAWINGYYFVSDTKYTLDLSQYVDESLGRYVIVGISCDVSDNARMCKLEVLQGTAATTPSVPSFVNTATKTYLTLAAILLNAGTETINRVVDYRELESKCGYVKCILGRCKVTEMQSQLAMLTAKIDAYNDQIGVLTNKVDVLQTKVDDLTGDIIETGEIGENAYYVLYSNGNLLLRGTGATYDYEIGKSPFHDSETIKNLVVSEGITAIGNSTFERCVNMASASFPNTLKSIGDRAFFMYTQGGLTTLNLPSSVAKIGEKAFVDQNLTTVTLPESLTDFGTYIFMGSQTLRSVRVECAEIPAFCFVSCAFLREMTLSRNVKKFNSHIVNYCSLLKSITYEGSLADWGKVAKSTNWDGNQGATTDGYLDKIVCLDGYMEYDREHDEWIEVKE